MESINNIRNKLKEPANAEIAKQSKYSFYDVKVPELRKIAKKP